MTAKLTKGDMLIITNLRNNARMSLTEMSKKTKVPISTIYDKLRGRLKEIITKQTALIDFTKLGFSARVQIILKIDKSDREEVKSYLSRHRNINSVYKINNSYDLMAEGIFKDMKEAERFIEKLEVKFNIKQLQVYYIVEDIKRESFLNNGELLGLIL
jgi:DNA-binding Lrp family transcriptional regulator